MDTLDQLPLEYRILATLHQFPFGGVVDRQSPPMVEMAYHWLKQQGYVEQKEGQYWLTDVGAHMAWKMASGRHCGTCYWWKDGKCGMPASPSTVNCGSTRWHDVCEQHDFR